MLIDHCLILAAGFGTRMGEIGKQLPKVLWPVFEKSLLELQVAYAKRLGAKNIYINLHHMGEAIESYCRSKAAFEDVQFLWEKPEILDIGGAIHNLASHVDYKGKLLVLNADQFFYLKQEEFSKRLEAYQNYPVVLFNYWVNSSLGYNAIEVDEKRLVKRIIKNKDLPKDVKIETYTGISVIDLDQLTPTKGASDFYQSVCPFSKKEIPAVMLDNVDYWDFGTLRRYWETTFKMLEVYREKSTHPFLRFLVEERALKTWKIDLQKISYHASSSRVVNLNPDKELRDLNSCIIVNGLDIKKKDGNTIWYKGMVEEVK